MAAVRLLIDRGADTKLRYTGEGPVHGLTALEVMESFHARFGQVDDDTLAELRSILGAGLFPPPQGGPASNVELRVTSDDGLFINRSIEGVAWSIILAIMIVVFGMFMSVHVAVLPEMSSRHRSYVFPAEVWPPNM